MNTYRGLRIITNLHCQYRCKFCYQVNKPRQILSLKCLTDELMTYQPKSFGYCTVMGGESTLLPDLHKYISIGNALSVSTRLTTNGANLTEESLTRYKESGLTGINISVASLKQYQEITQSNLTSSDILDRIHLAKSIFPNQVRINIALCKENVDGEISDLIHFFLHYVGVNVTICEDILSTYSLYDCPEKMGATFVENTGYGLSFFNCDGKVFGYYSHADNYKNTDLVVTPVGTFVAWDKFCETIGINYEN